MEPIQDRSIVMAVAVEVSDDVQVGCVQTGGKREGEDPGETDQANETHGSAIHSLRESTSQGYQPGADGTCALETGHSTDGGDYGSCALNGALAIVLPQLIAMRPPSVVTSRNAQVSCSTLKGRVSTFMATRATSFSGV